MSQQNHTYYTDLHDIASVVTFFLMQLRKEATAATTTTSSYADIDQNSELHNATSQAVSSGPLFLVS